MANQLLTQIQKNSSARRNFIRSLIHPYRAILIQILSVFLFYMAGVLFYHHNMGWNIIDCIYFITVSITTVGYGDYSPDNDGRPSFITVLLKLWSYF